MVETIFFGWERNIYKLCICWGSMACLDILLFGVHHSNSSTSRPNGKSNSESKGFTFFFPFEVRVAVDFLGLAGGFVSKTCH